jgi:hypothetical protein
VVFFISGQQYLKLNYIPQTLIDGMRIALMNDEEIYFYDDKIFSNDSNKKVISIRNERKVWSTLKTQITTLLNKIGDVSTVRNLFFLLITNHYEQIVFK